MSDLAKNFVEQFHNVPGTTIKEKHQNLFHLLHQHISLRDNPEDLEYITRNLAPGDHLQKIFRVDFLVYFHRFNELYEDFKNGDQVTIRKLSKQEWFFQKAFAEVGAEDFVNKILPTTSFSLKVKILRKLPVEDHQADEFFDAVCKRYELFLATNLLPKCSSDKIRETITTKPVKLTIAQLQYIYKKDPDLMYPYFEERTKHKGDSNISDYKPLLQYIAQKNPKMFSDLFNKYKFDIKLGRRTTKRFIDAQKEDVVKKPEEYLSILKKTVIVRKLGLEIKNILFKGSLKRPYIMNWEIILEYYPPKQRFNIYRCAYDAVYRHKLEDNLDAVPEDILKMMEDKEERQRFANLKAEKEDNNEYLKYVKPDYCLNILMEKINQMKKEERADYIGVATYCCISNKDLDNFSKICELVCDRFKNDGRVLDSFLSNFFEAEDFLGNLTDHHWKLIMEVVATIKSKNEYISNEEIILKNYVKYLIENNKSIKEIVAQDYNWTEILMDCALTEDVKVSKALMTEIIEVGYPKPDPDDEIEAVHYDCTLANICRIYNERNPRAMFNVYDHPRIRKSVKKLLETEQESYIADYIKQGAQYMVCQIIQTEEVKELKKLYFKQFESYGRISGLMWFLKYDPETLQENFDDFLNNTTKVWNKKLWRIIKKYSDLASKTIESCKLKLGGEFYYKNKLVTVLTILAEPSAHLQFIKSYIPTSYNVDLTDDECREMYTIQGNLFKVLHFLNDPRTVLPLAYKLCRGDYLQFALHPLYSCIYKLPENECKQYIDKLDATKAVSVKKHAMNLTCIIYDTDTVCECLKNATVPSLVSTMKYFAKNPSITLWEYITNRISNLEKKEYRELKSAMSVRVPFNYRSRFVEILWKVFEKHENQEYRKVLLPKIDHKTIQNFNPNFAVNIIRGNVFKLEEANNFICSLLIHLKGNEKFDVLKELMTEFRQNHWDDKETKGTTRNKLNKFMRSLFHKYMEAENPDRKFVSQMSQLFKSIFSLSETFEEWLMLSFMSFKDETPENCAKVLAELNRLLTEKYDKFAVTLLASALCNFAFKYTFKSENEKIRLYHALLEVGVSPEDRALVLKLLPKREPQETEYYNLYEEIYSKLSQAEEEVVQLQFNLFLKSDKSQEKVIDWGGPQPEVCLGTC